MNVSRTIRHPLFLTLAVFFVAPVVVMPLGGMSLAIEVMIWAIFAISSSSSIFFLSLLQKTPEHLTKKLLLFQR